MPNITRGNERNITVNIVLLFFCRWCISGNDITKAHNRKQIPTPWHRADFGFLQLLAPEPTREQGSHRCVLEFPSELSAPFMRPDSLTHPSQRGRGRPLLAERGMGNVERGQPAAGNVRDRGPVARALEKTQLREGGLQEVDVEARLDVRNDGPQPVYVVLERHGLDLARPDRRAADLAALADQQVARPQQPGRQLMVGNRHFIDHGQVDLVPQDIRGPKEGRLVRAVAGGGGHGLAGADLEQFAERTPRPGSIHGRRPSISTKEASISRASSSRRRRSATISPIGRCAIGSAWATQRLGLRL